MLATLAGRRWCVVKRCLPRSAVAAFRLAGAIGLSLAIAPNNTFGGAPGDGMKGPLSTNGGFERDQRPPNEVVSPLNPDICTSDRVVVATVIDRESNYVYSPGAVAANRIMTDVYVRADRNVFGKGGSQLTVKVDGGTVDDITIEASGEPRMPVGSTYALALVDGGGTVEPWGILAFRFIPPDAVKQLPSDAVLRGMWTSWCASHPEGIAADSRASFTEMLGLAAEFNVEIPFRKNGELPRSDDP